MQCKQEGPNKLPNPIKAFLVAEQNLERTTRIFLVANKTYLKPNISFYDARGIYPELYITKKKLSFFLSPSHWLESIDSLKFPSTFFFYKNEGDTGKSSSLLFAILFF